MVLWLLTATVMSAAALVHVVTAAVALVAVHGHLVEFPFCCQRYVKHLHRECVEKKRGGCIRFTRQVSGKRGMEPEKEAMPA